MNILDFIISIEFIVPAIVILAAVVLYVALPRLLGVKK